MQSCTRPLAILLLLALVLTTASSPIGEKSTAITNSLLTNEQRTELFPVNTDRNSRHRRSVPSTVDGEADACSVAMLQKCGEVVEALASTEQMSRRCDVREEFLNCMMSERQEACPTTTPMTVSEVKALRKLIRKKLVTNCLSNKSKQSGLRFIRNQYDLEENSKTR